MNRRALAFSLLALALSACAATPKVVIAPGAGPAELEAIHGVSATRDGLTVRVSSNGCTRKEDFAFFVETKAGAMTVAFARKRLDRCQSFAAGHADLAFTFAELGVPVNTELYVLNPFAADPSPGQSAL